MDDLSIVPLEVLSIICILADVKAMQSLTGNIGSSHLHEAWQLAVTLLNIPWNYKLSLSDVQHIMKFRNLEKIRVEQQIYRADSPLPSWHLVSQFAPALSKLRSLDLKGSSSFEVLKVLQGSEVLQQRITALKLKDINHVMTIADFLSLASMKALKELALECRSVPKASSEASQALAKTLDSLSLVLWAEFSEAAELRVFPGSITSLKKLDLSCEYGSDDQICTAFTAAVSSLVGLQDLQLWSIDGWTAEQQRQALGGMTCLTRMLLLGSSEPLAVTPVATIQKLDVQGLHIQGAVADAVLGMKALWHVTARSLQPTAAWRGKVIADCLIQELELAAGQRDEDLRNLPRLPHLKSFELTWEDHTDLLAPSDGRYLHLARLLQQHAATLEHVTFGTEQEVKEALPDLPVCRELKLEQDATGSTIMQTLAAIRMPLLEKLYLGLSFGPEVEQSELAWLVQLPALQRFQLNAADEEVRAMVRSMFESRPLVELVLSS